MRTALLMLVTWAALSATVSAARKETVPLNSSTGGTSASELAAAVRLPYEKRLPGAVTDYVMLTFTSPWGHEYLMRETMLPPEGFRYIQKQGRSCQGLKPYCMLYNTKTQGGIAVSLAYSGNWQIEIKPQGDRTVLRVATSPPQLCAVRVYWRHPIPGALVAEFSGHWDYDAQPIARFIRRNLLRNLGDDWPPVQYNNWYGAEGNFDEKSLFDSAGVAAEVGCELFTVDAGWYGGQSGGDWNQALGDWTVNRQKIPAGLEGIAKEARRRGMKFGLWIEIECAGPNTPIARQHPEWYLREGNRQLSNRGVLDFGNSQVLAWAKSVIDDLMTRYPLGLPQDGFQYRSGGRRRAYRRGNDPLYGHYSGLVRLWKYLREKYPAAHRGELLQRIVAARPDDGRVHRHALGFGQRGQ